MTRNIARPKARAKGTKCAPTTQTTHATVSSERSNNARSLAPPTISTIMAATDTRWIVDACFEGGSNCSKLRGRMSTAQTKKAMAQNHPTMTIQVHGDPRAAPFTSMKADAPPAPISAPHTSGRWVAR
ncbi:hypothetical protein Y013_17870 [Rhodococcus pyridinivorans SB3094]|uniref:Uncharacterized protein n=1 Tax=Rhodococcus pyridinivorans SB3094 TaxID=1435356 RepID=V9XN85_9NOCA|nr:hypothetical protein [Rhodococcus sp. PAE-6]AHD23863.1 hypothetical protein Y013_17870 [Rhodococcus pyridinivorans SB3094]MCT7293314.1 hypothetical protein [Rhodococcus sp. PAE-6]